jgi:hypothetical protein
MNLRVGFLGVFLAVAVTAAPLCAAPPQIARCSPLALAPGKSVDVTILGQNLLGARSLWTTFAARCEFVAAADESTQKGEKLLCRVTVPRGEEVGIGAVRVVTGEGVSNPILVMLDDLPSVAETADNHAIEQAQPINWPTAVDGQSDPVQEDFFRIHVAAGRRVSCEVVSQRLGSALDPVLRLVALDGNEVARLDDAAGAGGDCRLAHIFAAEGDYLLAVGDVRHAGGDAYRYRLRVGSFPLVTAVYPAGGRSGTVMSFALAGDEAEAASTVNVDLPDTGAAPRLVSFSVPSADGAGSGWFQVEANPGLESLEHEPNDGPAEATAAQVPGVLNGRLDKVDDRDHFKFQARKGQRVHCVALTRELGSDCDLYLRLLKSDGSQIAVASQDRQTVLDAEIPEDGEYVLRVDDLLVGGSPGHVYRIDVSDTFAGFALNAEQTQYSGPQGGTFVMKVLAQRRGYNGPIELAVEGLGDGVGLEGSTFEGAETLLKITLPANIGAGELRHARIIGKAKVGEQTMTVAANQREPLRAVFPNALSLPTQLENTIAVGVGPTFPPYFDLSLASTQLYFPQLVGVSTFDINIARTNEAFKDAVSFAVEGLPAGVTAEVAPVEDGSKAYRVTLKGPVDLAEGEFPIRIVGTGKFQEQTRTVALENLTLRVTKPLVVSVALAGPIVAGGQQQADVRLERFGEGPQPVRLQFSDGPAGLSAPIVVTIPGDANQAKIPLAAAADAAAGKFDNLVVVASTTVMGQNVTVSSKPASVEIQPAAAK